MRPICSQRNPMTSAVGIGDRPLVSALIPWLFGSVVRGRENTPRAHSPRTRLRSDYGRERLDEVLAADCRDSVGELLAELAVDRDFWKLEIENSGPPKSLEDLHVAISESARRAQDEFEVVLGRPAAERYRDGCIALVSLVWQCNVIRQLVGPNKSEQLVGPNNRSVASDVVDVFYDAETPLVLRREVLRLVASMLAGHGILRADELGTRLAPWLAFDLADRFASAAESLDQGFANLGEVLKSAEQEARAEAHAQAYLAARREEALASDELIFFPFASERHGEGL